MLSGTITCADCALEVGDDEPRQRQRAPQLLLAVDDEQLVGVRRQFVQRPQVARRRLQGHVLAHRDLVEIHQRADRALLVGERGAQQHALFLRQRANDVLDHLLRQVGRQVGDLVGLESLRRRDQLAANPWWR